jgi:predicted RNA binding protein YcfA (HicA-like mRNA interferase family)
MKVVKVKAIIKALEQAGWYLYRHNGTSHGQFKHNEKTGKVTVNGKPSSDITGDLLKSIEKQSGITF